MANWKSEVDRLVGEGKKPIEIIGMVIPLMPSDVKPIDYENRIRRRIRTAKGEDRGPRRKRRIKRTQPEAADEDRNIQEIAMMLLHKGTTMEAIQRTLGLSPKVAEAVIGDLRAAGYNIMTNGANISISKLVVPDQNILRVNWNGDKIIRFGLLGDTHINSKYAQLTYLHTVYDMYEREGIKTVYHTGDIDSGEKMREGQQYENYSQGADDHVAEIVRVYPSRPGIETCFITGNHDASFIKHVGLDIGVLIADKRRDMKYLGQQSAVVYLTDNCTLELRHPIDGTAYAISYKMQKMIEALSGGEKPNLLASGHYHKMEFIFYRNIHTFQTGCMEAQTPWMRGKQISAHVGAWIIEVHVSDDGSITRVKPEWIPFYKMIKEDWKNWERFNGAK